MRLASPMVTWRREGANTTPTKSAPKAPASRACLTVDMPQILTSVMAHVAEGSGGWGHALSPEQLSQFGGWVGGGNQRLPDEHGVHADGSQPLDIGACEDATFGDEGARIGY